MLNFLSHPAWQGIGSIAGIVSIVVSLMLANNSLPRITSVKYTYRVIIAILSLMLPTYTIFVASIVLANQFTQAIEVVLYCSVALASILGVLWGIIWITYIRNALITNYSHSNNQES